MTSRRLIANLWAALACIIAAGCVAARYRPPKMPFTIATASGTVHASSLDEAKNVAEMLETYGPRVQAILGTGGDKSPEITLVRGDLPGRVDLGGVCYKPDLGSWFIVLQSFQHPMQSFVLVHELVHFYSAGIWDRLSPTMQEGFADEVASSLVPPDSSSGPLFLVMSALFSNSIGDPRPFLDGGQSEFSDLDLRGRTSSRGIGYFVAHRLGVERLKELCLQAEKRGDSYVSAQDLLETAGLSLTDIRMWYGHSDTQEPVHH